MFIKKFFGAILLLTILTLPQNVSATKTDWFDRNYNFRNVRTVIVFDMTVSPGLNYGGPVVMRNIQDTFVQNARKNLKCEIITEAQARQRLGLEYSNPEYARRAIMDNAYKIADAWVVANVDNLANTYYIEPERTVWESRTERRRYYDRYGNRREETYTIQVPVTYPPRRVDISTIEMTLQAYETRRGEMIFARRDVRDREDYQAQAGMYGRICNSFFEDFGKKIR